MRRSDREITDFYEIMDILRQADTIRLGLHTDPYPYVVPLSFGFEAIGEKIHLYFHGATEGFKHDLIAQNPRVCVEADIFYGYKEVPGSVTAEYESFIGFGETERITGEAATYGMDLMLTHCGFDGFAYDHMALDHTWIYKIALDSYAGKRRFVRKDG